MTKVLFLFMALLGLTGCASHQLAPPDKVEIPIECRIQAPQRPAMPTRNLTQADSLDTHVKTIQAEIDVREGYEIELKAALEACMSPVNQK